MKIRIFPDQHFRVEIDDELAGGTTPDPEGWWAYTMDRSGNLYGLGHFKTKVKAIARIKAWHTEAKKP